MFDLVTRTALRSELALLVTKAEIKSELALLKMEVERDIYKLISAQTIVIIGTVISAAVALHLGR